MLQKVEDHGEVDRHTFLNWYRLITANAWSVWVDDAGIVFYGDCVECRVVHTASHQAAKEKDDGAAGWAAVVGVENSVVRTIVCAWKNLVKSSVAQKLKYFFL
jgi:hypothetical protein